MTKGRVIIMAVTMSVILYTPLADAVTAEEFLAVSGLKASFDKMPADMANSLFGNMPGSIPDAAKKELFSSYFEAYPQGSITAAVVKILDSGSISPKLPHLMTIVSTPISKKMIELELKKPTPEEMTKFTGTLASKPPGERRVALLKELIEETHSVDAFSKIAEVTGESLALATSNGCTDDVKRVRDGFAKARPTIRQSVYSTMMLGMAFTYRTASDEELRDYLATYKDPDAKMLQMAITKVAVNEYLLRWKSFEKVLERLGGDLSDRSMFDKSCRSRSSGTATHKASAVAVDNALAVARPVRLKPSGTDARKCLDLDGAVEVVAACAEKYR